MMHGPNVSGGLKRVILGTTTSHLGSNRKMMRADGTNLLSSSFHPGMLK